MFKTFNAKNSAKADQKATSRTNPAETPIYWLKAQERPNEPAHSCGGSRFQNTRQAKPRFLSKRISFKIVNDATAADFLENFLDEFHVPWMNLVFVLRFLILENEIESDLVTLFHHWPMAFHHSADMEHLNPRNRFQVLLCPRDESIGSEWVVWIRPKNNNVRKHAAQRYEAVPHHSRLES